MKSSNPPILNVDDYAPGRYARTKILQQAGFQVVEAADGKEAFEQLARHKPAIVLLDVNLPDMTGFEVCKQIKKNPKTASTTVVHISASNIQVQHLVHGLDSGADSYLVEPLDPTLLVATVKAFLRARQAEDALRRSNEDLERFAYMVAHDLNEPLRTVTSHAQLLARQLADNMEPETGERLGSIIDGAHRMRTFIDDILRYSQASHGGSDVRAFDCQAMVSRITANLGAAIGDSGAQVTADPLPVVIADARIEHVFQNLISNAIKYRKKDVAPEIHISAKWERGEWTFSIRDNGVGISPEYRETVFHIFRRLHGRDIPGNGIGLALSKKVVETHGGRIWLESVAGQGSTFYFTLPQDQAATAVR